ncbi:MAG: pantoate--beta-alanine ligase, partial [Ginsengibacter sp.]
EEKIKASKLFSSLEFIKNNRNLRSFSDLKDEAISTLQKEGFNVEYLAMAKTKNLELTDTFQQNETYVLLIAAFLNKIRLIDNLVIAG